MTGRGFSRFTSTILLVFALSALGPAAILAQSETPAPPAATEEPGALPTADAVAVVTVTGTITNGTTGGAVPADVAVTLRVISPELAETSLPAVVAADGTFTVADVPVYPNHVYLAAAEYQGAVFSSDLVTGTDLPGAPALPVTVYELTDDPSVISISGLQAQAAVSMNEMQVLELYQFVNSSDRAYRAPDGASVRVTVPEGAQIYDMGTARFLVSEDGRQMIDNALVLPGEAHSLHVLFSLPYGGQATVTHPVLYPLTNGFEVVISDPGLSVTGEGMAPLGGSDAGMTFGVQASVPAGGDISFTVSGTPAPAPPTAAAPGSTTSATATAAGGSNIPPLSVLLMVLGGACVGVALVLFVRDRRRKPASKAVDPRVNALMQQIAELDVAYQAGSISKEDYETQRAALKDALMKLARSGEEG